jgi:hypothetical protein
MEIVFPTARPAGIPKAAAARDVFFAFFANPLRFRQELCTAKSGWRLAKAPRNFPQVLLETAAPPAL